MYKAKQVLVADDEPMILELFEAVVRLAGYDPCLTTSGADAVEAACDPDVALAILDVRMPGLDGFQICRTIKADPESSSTVVIAMTGFFSSETEARILECGAVRCFAKPVEASTLAEFIDSVFEQQAAGRGRRRKPTRS